MSTDLPPDLAALLNRMPSGEVESGNQAMEAVYGALRRIASDKLRRERPNHLLDTGALVNESMLRLFGARALTLKNRSAFSRWSV